MRCSPRSSTRSTTTFQLASIHLKTKAMTKLKYWLLSIAGAICCAQQSDAQTITVLTTDGNTQTITNVDSIQLFEGTPVSLTMLKADHSSVKFQVSAPKNAHWVYTLIPSDRYATLKQERDYLDEYFLRKGAHQVGSQIVEINDGDPTPHPTEWWDGTYSIKPGTAYCLLVAMAQKTYLWDNEQGTTAWAPIISTTNPNYGNPSSPDDEQSNAPFVPDYTNEIRLGNYLTQSTDADMTYNGFFYQQYFWTAAPTTASEAPIVSIGQKSHTAIHYTITPPSKAHSCKVLLLSDSEYANLLQIVGEYGIDAHVLANGQPVVANTEICADSLIIGDKYHILATASFDEQGKVQSSVHQEVKTLSSNETEPNGSMPIVVMNTTNASTEEVSLDDYRNDSIADPFNVPSFTRVKALTFRTFNFETIFPTLAPGHYKVSAIVVPTAYHKLLEPTLVDSRGLPYVEQVKFSASIHANKKQISKTPSKVTAPSDRVEQVVLFEDLEITDIEDATYTIIFDVATLDLGTSRSPKCEALNIYKLIIEPCDAGAAKK